MQDKTYRHFNFGITSICLLLYVHIFDTCCNLHISVIVPHGSATNLLLDCFICIFSVSIFALVLIFFVLKLLHDSFPRDEQSTLSLHNVQQAPSHDTTLQSLQGDGEQTLLTEYPG